jgi:hypothetical protein
MSSGHFLESGIPSVTHTSSRGMHDDTILHTHFELVTESAFLDHR